MFFDQYQYGLRCQILHITAIRHYTGNFVSDGAKAQRMLDMMKCWNTHISIVRCDRKGFISPRERDNILDFLAQLCTVTAPLRTAVSGNTVWVYSNDIDFLQSLADSDYNRRPELIKVHLDRPRDTVMLKKSDYQFRTYFRDCNITSENRQYLENWIHNQQDIRLSPGLQEWRTNNWRNLYSNYFFDHNDIRLTQMLGLILPRAIKTTKTIVIATK